MSKSKENRPTEDQWLELTNQPDFHEIILSSNTLVVEEDKIKVIKKRYRKSTKTDTSIITYRKKIKELEGVLKKEFNILISTQGADNDIKFYNDALNRISLILQVLKKNLNEGDYRRVVISFNKSIKDFKKIVLKRFPYKRVFFEDWSFSYTKSHKE
jgi:hypothetical protein